MSDKMQLRTGDSLLVLNLPQGLSIEQAHSTNPADRKQFDVVLLYVSGQAELERFASVALGALKADGILWVAFPNPESARHRDLTPGNGWELLRARGFEAIAEVDFDAEWSALSLRHRAFIGNSRRR